jgi:hypothetical protein
LQKSRAFRAAFLLRRVVRQHPLSPDDLMSRNDLIILVLTVTHA